ncbi:hypothetical protein BKA62DRAFT_233256 [Auriculariales sp. MPI-PUGE-AT-0066]|nr:hypothetical protein BKA62DRAFT_233256 [Auriculariales sp. MPI-PUGE-AT-0066]
MPGMRTPFSDITTDCAYDYLMNRLSELQGRQSPSPVVLVKAKAQSLFNATTGGSELHMTPMRWCSCCGGLDTDFGCLHLARRSVRTIAPLVVGRFATGLLVRSFEPFSRSAAQPQRWTATSLRFQSMSCPTTMASRICQQAKNDSDISEEEMLDSNSSLSWANGKRTALATTPMLTPRISAGSTRGAFLDSLVVFCGGSSASQSLGVDSS